MDLFETLSKPVTSLREFFNTTNLSGEELKKRQIKTGSQNEKVLHIFSSHPRLTFTAWEVLQAGDFGNTPITSIRRAITTLTDMGYLEMTPFRRKGQYDELCYAWQLKPDC